MAHKKTATFVEEGSGQANMAQVVLPKRQSDKYIRQ
jgi:hypothetical protein